MRALELIEVDDAIGIALPDDVLARLKIGEGDVLHLTETNRGILLTLQDPSVATQVEARPEEPRE